MRIDETVGSTFNFQIPSGGMRRFVTSGTGGLKIQTSVILINSTALPTSGWVEFLASDGTPLQLRAGGMDGGAFKPSPSPFGV